MDIMVKAADSRIEFGSNDSVFFKKISDYKDGVGLEVHKKFSLRRFFFPLKGRRKEKDVDTTNKPYLADDLVSKRISNVDLERLVEAPQGLDHNEWLATHTISFFEHLNLLYGSVSEYCTSTVCSSMSGPSNMQYLWVDPKGKKCKCAAPQYVDYVMLASEQLLNDESVFPTKYGNSFPATFEWTVRRIMTWLYHVLAHLYHAHYKEVVALCLHAHLNTLFLHFNIFCKRHNLLDDKETEILDDLYEKLRQPPVVRSASSSSSSENVDPAAADHAAGDTVQETSLQTVDDTNKEKTAAATTANANSNVNVKSPSRSSRSSSSSSCGAQHANGQATTAAAAATMS